MNHRLRHTTRRAFLKQTLVFTGASAAVALLNGCGSPSSTTTADPTAASQPTLAPTIAPALTMGVTGEATDVATAAATSEVTAEATMVSDTTAGATEGSSTPAIVAAANAFLATLNDDEKNTVLFDWTDTEQKQRWSNFPDGAFDRAGLTIGNMSDEQRSACLQVLQTILSTEGYNRVLAEWNADDALAGGGGGGANFGTDYYYTAIIGTPSETDPWQWQWGGHHVTINATLVGPNLSLTPSFIGVEPREYTDANGNTVRPLGDIETDAFALIGLLDSTQQQTAILGDTPTDLVLGPGQDGKTIQAEGLSGSQMTAEQQAAFLKLIGHYTGLANDASAATRKAEVESTLGETYLAWYGGTTQGNGAYFRVTGPTIVIEYSPQGDRGSGAASGTEYHVHGIYRDPTNEYGAKYVA